MAQPADKKPRFRAPDNPDYGSGVFKRQMRIRYQRGSIHAQLEDDIHGFEAFIEHDGSRITAIDASARRYPFSTCISADKPLQAFVNCPLLLSTREYYQRVSSVKNCTHIYDLVLTALFHYHDTCQLDEAEVFYDITVSDAREDQPSEATIHINGEQQHCWTVSEWRILQPQTLHDKPLLKGFMHWALKHFDGLAQHSALMLQKGVFVAQARRYQVDALAGGLASEERYARNVCHTYSSERAHLAVRRGNNQKDFTQRQEELLKFIVL